MKAIETTNLKKTYRTRVKAEGVGASLQALMRPDWREIQAVWDISMDVDQGEIVAFIGPNGAGKSTFIKMLSGILHPTEGTLSVLGLTPSKDRRQLAMRIGTVFGQKSQLWLHLPALDSFTLLAAIYEIDDKERRRRVGELSELFGLGDFLKTPVRKLSLGQRIRCEVAASLLHEPELLFLDEPTIGLDVVVKQAIRELILRRNRERGTTIFLTSHDPADIEHICRRAVVIDHGAVVLDLPVEQLRRNYLRKKQIEVQLSAPQELPQLEGVSAQTLDGGLRAALTVDTSVRPIGEVMEKINALGNVVDITITNPPMEDIIAAIFQKEGKNECNCENTPLLPE